MTCIVGLVDNGRVCIGGDSAGVSGIDLIIRADKKVFRSGDFVFGFTSSFRMGQLLRYSFVPPKHISDKSIDEYMVTDFVDAVRECLKKGGYATKQNDVETAGTFLVGYKGKLFCIEDDYQVGESSDDYYTCGCGYLIANGSLFATSKERLPTIKPEDRILVALRAAENHSAGVRGPFTIVSV